MEVVRAKLHGLHVTGADLDYHGSITLDPDHCDAVGLLPMEFVEVWNKHSGARLQTYVIHGERGSRCCVLNGAAVKALRTPSVKAKVEETAIVTATTADEFAKIVRDDYARISKVVTELRARGVKFE